MTNKLMLTLAMFALPLGMTATDYYVSATGSNDNDGRSEETPLASLSEAQKRLSAGDIVYLMPDTFRLTNSDIMATDLTSSSVEYKAVFDLSKSGKAGNPIRYIGLTDEAGRRPVFDLSAIQVGGYRLTGFLVRADYLILKNIEVVGIKVDPDVDSDSKTQSENIRVTNGSHNTFENIACHDGWGIGFYLNKNSAYNLFVNCDGYNNYDPYSDINSSTRMGSGGNNDAFGCHVLKGNEGTVFIGCRAWNNSDDGYDLISCSSVVTFSYSIAYRNGYDADGVSRGDGTGFNAGGYGMSETADVTEVTESTVPRHEVHHSIAANNKANGFYSNHHLGGVYFHDNTAYRNGRFNYSLVNRQGFTIEEAVDVNGYNHRLERNLSIVESTKDNHVTYLRGDEGNNRLKDNSFRWVSKNSGGWAYEAFGNSIFESTRTADLTAARNADGMLSDQTLAVMRQRSYVGLGCTFDDYEQAIENARTKTGAESSSTTAISSIAKEAPAPHDDAIYDLQGRKVTSLRKGLYICNGKKIIIR